MATRRRRTRSTGHLTRSPQAWFSPQSRHLPETKRGDFSDKNGGIPRFLSLWIFLFAVWRNRFSDRFIARWDFVEFPFTTGWKSRLTIKGKCGTLVSLAVTLYFEKLSLHAHSHIMVKFDPSRMWGSILTSVVCNFHML